MNGILYVNTSKLNW